MIQNPTVGPLWGTGIAPAADILKRDVRGAPKIDPGAVS